MVFYVAIIIFASIDHMNKGDSYELKFFNIEVSNIMKTTIHF